MIELTGHIEVLLLENDCVIVPDFGGFIAHYQPARYVKEENLYLPPVRTIGFNPQLTMNDGLLAQSYMQARHTDFPDATRMIEEEVARLKEQLYKNGYAEMRGIGVLHYTVRGTYEFHPREDGTLSPALYGLDSFSIDRLEHLATPASAATGEPLPRQEKRKEPVRFQRRWIGHAVAAAIAVVLFFILSVPAENTYVDKGNYASLGTDGLFDAIRSQSLATTLVAVPSEPQQPKKNAQHKLRPVAVKVEKMEKVEKAGKVESAGKVEQVGKEGKAGKVEQAENVEKVEKTGKAREAARGNVVSANPNSAAQPNKPNGAAQPVASNSVAASNSATAGKPAANKSVAASNRAAASTSATVGNRAAANKSGAASKPVLEKKEAASSNGKTPSNGKRKYHIIISSLATANDARQVLDGYKQKGYKEVTVVEGDGRYRLSLCSFADKAAAYKKLNELRQTDAFKNAWILNSK